MNKDIPLRLIKYLARHSSVLFAGVMLSFTVVASQSILADPFPIGQPFFNYSYKNCLPAPDIVITIEEQGTMGEKIVRQEIVKRDICHYYDAEGELLGWGYEVTGGTWY